MPEFAHPYAFLLAAPLGWLLWCWHRRRRPSLRFSSLSLTTALPPGRAAWSRRASLALRGLALACLLVALAGPRWPDPGSRVPTQGVSICLVIDVSDSMQNLDFLHGHSVQTRWAAVQKIVRLFLRGGEEEGYRFPGRPNDLFALVTFARRPETDCPLTLDHEALLNIVDEESPRLGQPTNPGDALAWGLHLLSKAPTERKVVIFLTDGEDNVIEEGPKGKPRTLPPLLAAEAAAAMGAPIYAIEIEPLPDESRPDDGKARKLMQDLARTSAGMFFSAKDTEGLLRAYAAIDEMERDRIESYQYRRYYDADLWFAVATLAVLLLTVLAETTLWRAGP